MNYCEANRQQQRTAGTGSGGRAVPLSPVGGWLWAAALLRPGPPCIIVEFYGTIRSSTGDMTRMSPWAPPPDQCSKGNARTEFPIFASLRLLAFRQKLENRKIRFWLVAYVEPTYFQFGTGYCFLLSLFLSVHSCHFLPLPSHFNNNNGFYDLNGWWWTNLHLPDLKQVENDHIVFTINEIVQAVKMETFFPMWIISAYIWIAEDYLVCTVAM